MSIAPRVKQLMKINDLEVTHQWEPLERHINSLSKTHPDDKAFRAYIDALKLQVVEKYGLSTVIQAQRTIDRYVETENRRLAQTEETDAQPLLQGVLMLFFLFVFYM